MCKPWVHTNVNVWVYLLASNFLIVRSQWPSTTNVWIPAESTTEKVL